MMRRRFLILTLIFFLGEGGLALATDYSSTNFIVKDPVLSGGGGYSTSDNFRLWSAFAQPAIGKSSADSFQVLSGFLYFSTTTAEGGGGGGGGGGDAGGGGGEHAIAVQLSELARRRIAAIITPPRIAPCGRSDFNCDGKVDLRDLSIVLFQPTLPTVRIFSVLLTDWTGRLPFLAGGVPSPRTEEFQLPPERRRPPEEGLAQAGSIFRRATGTPEYAAPRITVRSFLTNIVRGVVNVVTSLVRLILKPFTLLF